jgi:hypothetical protein
MKRFLLALALALGATSALAQVNVVPQVGVTFGYVPKVTYSAGFIGLVPAASATDVICLAGSATKTVVLQHVRLSGSAGTLVSLPITLVRRVAVNTGGTAASTTANPANTISKRDTNYPTATAVPISYTANPTITDTSPTYLDSASLTLPVTSAGVVSIPLEFSYYEGNAALLSPVVLRGAAAQVCLNFNAVSVSSGVLNGALTWTEE